jgi:hypothetical protein
MHRWALAFLVGRSRGLESEANVDRRGAYITRMMEREYNESHVLCAQLLAFLPCLTWLTLCGGIA